MSLNIYMDVDGTLINSNEGVDPRAKDVLEQIRRKLNVDHPDSGMFLWSGAGADYARSKAKDHGLTAYFDGFAGKPDIIIDDNPPSTFPRKAILWQGDNQWQNLTKSVFTTFSPSPELLNLVGDIVQNVQNTDLLYQGLYGINPLRYPIPFFGDLENAEVLTLAVNPSSTEFHEERGWGQGMDAAKISFRLVNYYRLWNPPPHKWFTERETTLRRNGCSYNFNAAHIDLSPRATLSMRTFSSSPGQFINMIKRDANEWLLEILRLAKNAKEIWFYGKIVAQGDWPRIEVFIQESLPEVWQEMQRFKHMKI